jgi:hypothetical protein
MKVVEPITARRSQSLSRFDCSVDESLELSDSILFSVPDPRPHVCPLRDESES